MIRLNSYGQLGIGHAMDIGIESDQMGDALQDADLGNDFVAIQVVAGRLHTCALSNSSQVKCWG